MKKNPFLLVLPTLLFIGAFSAWAASANREYSGSGEVVTTDPVSSQITIKHGAIKDFSGAEETQFFVVSKDLLSGIQTRDLVDFTVADTNGDVRITQIKKTGTAPLKENGLPVGQAVQDVLVATGEVAKTVTSPLPPAHEVVKGAVGATTDTTAPVLEDATTEVKKKF